MESTVPVVTETSHIWLVLIATIVSAAIQAAKKAGVLDRVSKRWIPVISLGTSIVGTIAASVASGQPLDQGLTAGILVGLTATGLYEVSKPRAKASAD